MADFEAKLGVNIDTSNAINSIKALQSKIAELQRQIANNSNINASSAKNFQRNLIADINASGKYVARMQQIRSTTEQFTYALERNKLSMGQYFRYAASTSKTFGSKFTTEFKTIEKVARERVKSLQTQYIAMGRDANGALQSIAVRPLKLDLNDLATQQAINAQKQQIFNQLLKQGSTNLLNFGKNTQWAGRQLMVGFTIPLSIFGSQAAKAFMSVEEQAIKFRRVYGELFTPPAEADQMLESLKALSKEFTQYGVSLEETLSLAGDVAAMGKTGADLLAQVEQATKLSVLGGVEQSKALESTISITNAFGIAAEDLAKKIDFLNAVENQTVLSIDDLTTAIPKAGPVVRQLGGSVEDLAFFMTAMKEGGVNASEGANALKSGLARMINPTQAATEFLAQFNININKIVEGNAGDIKSAVIELSDALDTLDPLNKARAIEELFGRFQFARISTLFQNISAEGTQASRVLDLTTASARELAELSSKELGNVSESTTFKFKKTLEEFQIAIAPIGEQFLKAVTPVIEFVTRILNKFDEMGDGAKNFVVILTTVLGAVAPIALMTFGLVANGVANLIKGFAAVRNLFIKTGQDSSILGSQIEYLTQEQLQAGAVAASLEQSHQRLTQQFTVEKTALDALITSYNRAITAGSALASLRGIPTTLGNPQRFANGGMVVGPGTGKSDSIMAMVSNGEAIIPADVVARNPGFFEGLISGKIPGFAEGGIVDFNGGSYSAPSSRSADAVNKYIDQLMALGNSAENVTAILKKLEDSGEKLTRANLEAAAKADENITTGRRGIVAGHTSKDIDPNSPEGMRAIQAAGYGDAPASIKSRVRIVSNQTASIPSWLNQVMKDDARGATVDEFNRGFTNTKNKYADTLKAEGLDMNDDEIIKEMNELEKEISELTIKLAKGGPIKDKHLQEAAATTIEKYEKRGSRVGRALGNAGRTAGQVRLSYSQDEYRSMLASGEIKQKPGTKELLSADGKYRMGRVDGPGFRPASPADLRGGYRGRTGKHSMFKMGAMDTASYQDGAKSEAKPKKDDQYPLHRDRKSPHRQARKDGIDDAKAYQSGAQSQAKKSRRAQGKMVDGQMQVVNPNARQSGPRRATSAPQTASRDAALARQAQQRQAAAQQAQVAANQRLTRASNGAMYALTTLSGMAAMAGGQIGQVGAVMFQVTAGMTALNAVMGMFTEKTLVQIALDRVKAASSAMETYSKVAATTSTNVFTAALGRASAGLMGFVGGPLGLGLIAAAAALGGFIVMQNLAAEAQKKAKAEVEALGAAASLAAGPLKDIASAVSGKDITGPNIGAFGVSADVRNKKDQILESPGLLDPYEADIEKLKAARPEDRQKIVDQLMIVLKGMQLESGDAQAVILAILQKAGLSNKGIDLNFDINQKDLQDQVINAMSTIDPEEYNRQKEIADAAVGDIESAKSARAEIAKMDAKIAEATAAATSGMLALSAEFANGAISAEEATAGIEDYENAIGTLPDLAKSKALGDIAEKLNIDRTSVENIEDTSLAFDLMKTALLGIDVPQSLIDAAQDLDSGDDPETMRTKLRLRKQLQKITKEGLELQAKAADQAVIDAAAADLSNLEAYVIEQEKKLENYNNLVEGGMDAAEAQKIVGDAQLYEAYTAALAADEINKLNGTYDEASSNVATFLAFVDRLNASGLPDLKTGGASTNPYEDAISQLQQQQTDIKNTTVAYQRLRAAGMDITTSARLASDSTTALALATTKVGTKKYKDLLELLKQIDKASKENAIKDLIRGRKDDIQLKSQFMKIAPIIQSLGVDMQDVMDILNDPDTARMFIADLKDGKLDSKDLLNYLKQIEQMKKIEVSVELMTDEGKWNKVDAAFSDVTKWFDAQKASIDAKYRTEITAQQKIIDEAQKKVDDYNSKLYELEYQLESIQVQEDAINEKYDARTKALDKILAVNKLIQVQEKGNLNIADALSQGDIAAAARAVQQARMEEASARAEDMKSRLEKAKEQELAAVRSADGRSRVDIENQIKGIKQDISKIEHDTIKPAEALRDASQAKAAAEKEALNYLGLNELAWGDLETAANKARVEAEAYKKAIEDAIKLLPSLTGKELPKEYTGDTSDANQKRIDELNRLRKISREKYQNSTDEAYKKRLYDINVARGKEIKSLGGIPMAKGGLVKYLAAGGFARGTDTVPAMLTPGEFVVRRQAVRNFGIDRLKAINSGTYGGDSVYNYNLSVNVKSDSNPDQIADAVITKIRQIDNKRIRGGRL